MSENENKGMIVPINFRELEQETKRIKHENLMRDLQTESKKGNIDYVRKVLKKTAWYTSVGEGYADVRDMDCKYPFFPWQEKLNGCGDHTPSHQVIDLYINNFKEDFRFEADKNPVKELQDRKKDNVTVGRCCKK